MDIRMRYKLYCLIAQCMDQGLYAHHTIESWVWRSHQFNCADQIESEQWSIASFENYCQLSKYALKSALCSFLNISVSVCNKDIFINRKMSPVEIFLRQNNLCASLSTCVPHTKPPYSLVDPKNNGILHIFLHVCNAVSGSIFSVFALN